MMTNWVVPPGIGHGVMGTYGAATTGTWTLSLITKCCEAQLIPDTSAVAFSKCSACGKRFSVVDAGSSPKKHTLSWGGYSWDEIESKISEWVAYWFGLDSEDIRVYIDGKDPKENMT